jgi:phage gp46-like protein
MKALGYAMFVGDFPQMEIETKVGLRYKPDLVARGESGDFLFWGEAGENSIRKTLWLLKHAQVRQLVLFKISINAEQFLKQLREEIQAKYRADKKLVLVNFSSRIVELTAAKQIEKVSSDWFSKTIV